MGSTVGAAFRQSHPDFLEAAGSDSGFVRPETYGADRFNDLHDDTSAIQQAIDTGGNVLLTPGGQYLISDTLSMEDTLGETLIGFNSRETRVVMTQRDRPIIRVDGENKRIAGLRLEYQGGPFTQGSPAGADAIYAHRMRWSEIHDVMTVNCEKGIHAPQETGIGGFFSNSITKLRVLGFSEYALDINSWSGTGNTGSAWSNIYLANNPSGTTLAATGCVRFRTNMETTFDQLNIENVDCVNEAMLLSSAEGISIRGLHMEEVAVTTDFGAFISLFGSRTIATFEGMQVILCNIDQTSRGRLFLVNSSSSLTVESLKLRNNSVTSPHFTLVGTNDGGVGCLVDIGAYRDESSDFTGLSDGFTVTSPPTIRRIGDEHYHLDEVYGRRYVTPTPFTGDGVADTFGPVNHGLDSAAPSTSVFVDGEEIKDGWRTTLTDNDNLNVVFDVAPANLASITVRVAA